MSFVSSNWEALKKNKSLTGSFASIKTLNKLKSKSILRDREREEKSTLSSSSSSSSSNTINIDPNVVALDCEMVGVGSDGTRSQLARCSIVGSDDRVLYDKYVTPVEKVTDYRSSVSGITASHLSSSNKNCVSFKQCQKDVAQIINDKIVVGHSLTNDWKVLLLSHPRHLIRDTSRFKLLCPDKPRSLKDLAKEHLHIDIQNGAHDSVVDARAALSLYRLFSVQWNAQFRNRMNAHIVKTRKREIMREMKKQMTEKQEAEAEDDDDDDEEEEEEEKVRNDRKKKKRRRDKQVDDDDDDDDDGDDDHGSKVKVSRTQKHATVILKKNKRTGVVSEV